MKRVVAIVLAMLLVTSFALFAGGEKESAGKVTAYTTLDEELARKVFNAFTEETGIQVDWVRLSTGECTARMEAEKENPQASIWYGGVGLGHIEAKDKGLTMPYDSPAAKMPEKFRDQDRYWSGIYAGPLCFESNTQALEKYGLTAPTSWEELADPKYKGHVQMANPGSSGTAYNVLATMVTLYGEEKAFEYMKRLDANITQYTRSGSAPGKNAAIGETTIAIGYAHDGVRLIAEGYPLEITFPSEGTGYEVASISLIKNGPAEELAYAKKLYDWALGETAAKIYTTAFTVPFVDVPLPKGALPISKVNTINQDDEWAAANKARLVEKWNAVIGGESRTEPKK
ncbi:ABC transporter substrate-binding protein [Sediminispirochaeta smaragdinae]|jgi:iron(III) transport system substrate-binding protein|uniref:Extracellular solute-binding protein family 1 n=1 Tax=Sediminispirochaeta smaragdinae (strain DSM 11293 / JCM 15392 / SEBR 4228) TaxID=573413 RepID=E1R972_SEDSS|nr:ABC transporter substrate-binding protein [Sediminispirochaeta smaragdinae]ADK83041.1 extracellular solute-binding protein family 1 [Sediminispirochaeta smaragdinae DSM 11293]